MSRDVVCRCGHNLMSHQVENAPACVHDGCGCTEYRRAASALPAGQDNGPTAEQVIAAGKRSASKRNSALAEKIQIQLADLARRLREERQAAEHAWKRDAEREKARADVARLTAELAAARKAARAATGTAGAFTCPDCPKTSDTQQGLGTHRAKAHGYRKAG